MSVSYFKYGIDVPILTKLLVFHPPFQNTNYKHTHTHKIHTQTHSHSHYIHKYTFSIRLEGARWLNSPPPLFTQSQRYTTDRYTTDKSGLKKL